MTKDWVGVWGRWSVAAHGEVEPRLWGLGLHLDAGPGTLADVMLTVGVVLYLGPLYAVVTLERAAHA